jgi:hypothetical protein
MQPQGPHENSGKQAVRRARDIAVALANGAAMSERTRLL